MIAFSQHDSKLLMQILLTAYENGNRAEGKAFVPTPDEWKTICGWIKDLDDSQKRYKEMYG